MKALKQTITFFKSNWIVFTIFSTLGGAIYGFGIYTEKRNIRDCEMDNTLKMIVDSIISYGDVQRIMYRKVERMEGGIKILTDKKIEELEKVGNYKEAGELYKKLYENEKKNER